MNENNTKKVNSIMWYFCINRKTLNHISICFLNWILTKLQKSISARVGKLIIKFESVHQFFSTI